MNKIYNLLVINVSFFSLNLFRNGIKKGRVDVKINCECVLVHVVLSNLRRRFKYDVYFLIGHNGINGIQKGYIVTDQCGNFNNTIRFYKKKLGSKIELFNKLSLILISSNEEDDITGFVGEKYDYKINNTSDEYCNNAKFDKIINSLPKYWPFLTNVEQIKTVKINSEQFEELNLNVLTESLKKYILNSLKFYGFLIFGKCIRENRNLYFIGIPDTYNEHQVVPMANMGSNKFYGIDMQKHPQIGDLGFWIVYI